MSGRNTSSEIAGRLELLGQSKRVRSAHCHNRLEALVAREVDENAGIVRIVLDNQENGIAGLDMRSRSS